MNGLVIGIDVQHARSCPFAVLNTRTQRVVENGWIATGDLVKEVQSLASCHEGAVFAIDAPRRPLPTPRTWYWRNKSGWYRGTGSEKGRGRHCEVVIKAYELANPQWTPLAIDAPEWMRNGFEIFGALEDRARALEVFPSASYRMLDEDIDIEVNVPLSGFLQGPKDMLDAIVAAVTAGEFLAGRGQEVGGGDGLGTIVLPRPITKPACDVLGWPAQ